MKQILLILSLFACINTFSNTGAKNSNAELASKKGLFSIQFSWNNDSFSKNMYAEVSFKKKGLLSKKKSSSGDSFIARRDKFINIELAPGEYEFLAVNLKGDPSIPSGKFLQLPIKGTFTIKTGQTTNGGMVFLVRQSKESLQIMNLKIDNTDDVKRYVKTFKNEFSTDVIPAWEFLPKEKVDKLIVAFADLLMRRESAAKRPKVKYTYSTLGMVFKMEKDPTGKVLDYELIPTTTYQKISKMSIKKEGKILCELENNSYLYGDDDTLPFMPLPKSLANSPELHELDDKTFLMVDRNRNIYTADNTFDWKDHTEFSTEFGESYFQAQTTQTKIYKGTKFLYLFTTGIGKNKLVLQSPYNDFDFKEINLSKNIKKVPLLTETETQLIIGPVLKLNFTAKRPGYIYVKNHASNEWKEQSLPFGDCYNFAPDVKDDTIFYTKCKESEWHRSYDSGKSWEPFKEVGTN